MDEQKTQAVLKMTVESGTEPNSCRLLVQQVQAELAVEQAPTNQMTNHNGTGRQSDQNSQTKCQIPTK